MSLIDNLMRLFSRKESQARIAMSVQRLGQPIQSTANFATFARDGYSKNSTVFRCVHLISTNASGIKWSVYKKKKDASGKKIELTDHPLKKLLERPNPMQGQSSFIEAVVAYLAITGNSYIEQAGPNKNGPPTELWPMRPEFVKIVPAISGFPAQYRFVYSSETRVFDCDFMKGIIPILHMKTFNPLDIWFGLSPMEAALLNVDQLNAANRWNLALMQNSASPSGIMTVEQTTSNPNGSLSDDKFKNLKKQIDESYAGATKAGRIMLLEGGLKWQSIALSPKEVEWLSGKEVTVKDICNVFGVPALMLGYGDATYANYEEARQAFYEDTIIPMMNFLQTELNNWLAPKFEDDVEIGYDADNIGPLVEKREKKYTSLQTVNFLTQNEKRAAVGYDEKPGWDVFVIGSNILAEPPEINNPDETGDPNPDPIDDNLEVEDETDPEEDPQNLNEGGQEDGKEKTKSKSKTKNSQEVVDEDEAALSFKLFNPLTRNELSTSWRRVNARRKHIERPFSKMLEEDFKDLARKLEKAAEGKHDANLLEYALLKTIEDNTPELKITLRKFIKYTVEDFGSIVFDKAKSEFRLVETKANERTWQDWAKSYIDNRTAKAITEIEGTTKKQVRKTVQRLVSEAILSDETDIDVAKELRDVFDTLSVGRSKTIARTEINAASNSATTEAVKALEIPGMQKEWVSMDDVRTRDGGKTGDGPNHAIMNGVSIPLDEKFTVPPDADMEGPGDPSAEPGQICNCRCTLIYRAPRK